MFGRYFDDALTQGERQGAHARVDAQLGEEPDGVGVFGLGADAELIGDLAVTVTFGQRLQYLALARGQPGSGEAAELFLFPATAAELE